MPVLVNPYRFATGSLTPVDLTEPWEVIATTTTVTGGAMSIGGYDFSTLVAVRLQLSGIVVTTDDSWLAVRFHIGGSESSSDYGWIVRPVHEGTTEIGTDSVASADAAIGITSVTSGRGVGNASTEAFSGAVTVFAPGATAFHPLAVAQGELIRSDGTGARHYAGGIRLATGAVSGFSVIGSSNIVSGKLMLLGIE